MSAAAVMAIEKFKFLSRGFKTGNHGCSGFRVQAAPTSSARQIIGAADITPNRLKALLAHPIKFA